MKPEIQVLKLNSGEEIVGYAMPEANTAIKYRRLINPDRTSGILERSAPESGVTLAFACTVDIGGHVDRRWLKSEIFWTDMIERKEIPYVFIPDKSIMCKIVRNRISKTTITRFENFLIRTRVPEVLNEHIDDHPFRNEEDPRNFDAGSQAVS